MGGRMMDLHGSTTDFQERLLATFWREAQGHIDAMTPLLAWLEPAASGDNQARALERLFREAHGLKGAAQVVDRPEIAAQSRQLERLVMSVRQCEQPITSAQAAALVDAVAATQHVVLRDKQG